MNKIVLVIIVIIVLLLLWIIITNNSFNKLLIKIDEAESGIDVALQKRHDVLVKMVDVVKSYAKYEEDTFSKIVELRNGMTMKEKQDVQTSQNETIDKIHILAEQYPQLRSSENYKMLQVSINDVEEHLQAARRLFNSNISLYNQKLVSFPASIIGSSIKHLEKRTFFEVQEGATADVKMDL